MLQEGTEDKTGCKSVGVLYQNLYNRNIKYYDYWVSFEDSFNYQFDRIRQLIYAITNKIERDILQLKKVRPETEDWITEMFHDKYYLPYNNINSINYQ